MYVICIMYVSKHNTLITTVHIKSARMISITFLMSTMQFKIENNENFAKFPELINQSVENFTNYRHTVSQCHQCQYVPASISIANGPSFENVTAPATTSSNKFKKISSARTSRRFRPYYTVRPLFSQFRRPVPMRLSCLCAGALRRNRIFYDEEKYPPLLVPFLESHDAKPRIQWM